MTCRYPSQLGTTGGKNYLQSSTSANWLLLGYFIQASNFSTAEKLRSKGNLLVFSMPVIHPILHSIYHTYHLTLGTCIAEADYKRSRVWPRQLLPGDVHPIVFQIKDSHAGLQSCLWRLSASLVVFWVVFLFYDSHYYLPLYISCCPWKISTRRHSGLVTDLFFCPWFIADIVIELMVRMNYKTKNLVAIQAAWVYSIEHFQPGQMIGESSSVRRAHKQPALQQV